jgi:hypothetical protein
MFIRPQALSHFNQKNSTEPLAQVSFKEEENTLLVHWGPLVCKRVWLQYPKFSFRCLLVLCDTKHLCSTLMTDLDFKITFGNVYSSTSTLCSYYVTSLSLMSSLLLPICRYNGLCAEISLIKKTLLQITFLTTALVYK